MMFNRKQAVFYFLLCVLFNFNLAFQVTCSLLFSRFTTEFVQREVLGVVISLHYGYKIEVLCLVKIHSVISWKDSFRLQS